MAFLLPTLRRLARQKVELTVIRYDTEWLRGKIAFQSGAVVFVSSSIKLRVADIPSTRSAIFAPFR